MDKVEYNMRHDYVRIWNGIRNHYQSLMSQVEIRSMMDPSINVEEERNDVIRTVIQNNIVQIKTLGDIFRKLDLFKFYPE